MYVEIYETWSKKSAAVKLVEESKGVADKISGNGIRLHCQYRVYLVIFVTGLVVIPGKSRYLASQEEE